MALRRQLLIPAEPVAERLWEYGVSRVSATGGRRARLLSYKALTPKLLYSLSLEAQVPEVHLLRRVAAAVDFAFVRRLTARFYGRTGRPGPDPVVLFKLSLLGYLYGITSERRLAEEVRLHLACRWFLGYDLDEATPDHLAQDLTRPGLA